MSEQPYTQQIPPREPHDGSIAPPPRILWLLIGLFMFFVIVAISAVIIYQSQQRLVALAPLVVVVVFGLMFACILAAVMFRRSLPRHFPVALVLIFFVLTVIGVAGSVFLFANFLLPEYQQVVVEEAPFMRVFLPPTPEGGVLPTALPGGSDISPEDLLGAPLLGVTDTPETTEEPEPTQEPTEAAALIEPTAAPTNTPLPSPTMTVTPSPTSTPAEVAQAAQTVPEDSAPVSIPRRPSSEVLTGFTHVRQTWNNCGPANITMALSYYGWRDDQSVAAAYLRPNPQDKNVNPSEMVAFVNERTSVRAITRIGGDVDLLRDFIAARFPVIIETGYTPQGYDWIGHYQTIVGYDDLEGVFYIYDSYLGAGENGAGRRESYGRVDENWRHFNRTFIVVYEPSREAEVSRILGDLADPTSAAEHALTIAQQEARANRQDAFAWFNMGTALTKLERYSEAAAAYDQALRIGALPWRMTWYQFGPFEAYFYNGRYDDVMALVNANLTNQAQVEETYYWQGRVYEAQGNTSAAINAYTNALQQNPRFVAAREARDTLTS